MFLDSNPELLAESALATLERALRLMKEKSLDAAEEEVNSLLATLSDLPMATQLSALFERAVIYFMRAKEQAKGSKEQEKSPDTGADFIIDWFKKGEQGGFKAIGRTASAEVGRMLSDTDLLFLTLERRAFLKKEFPGHVLAWSERSWRRMPYGTLVDTTKGRVPVESLRPGDQFFSLVTEGGVERVATTIAAGERREPIDV